MIAHTNGHMKTASLETAEDVAAETREQGAPGASHLSMKGATNGDSSQPHRPGEGNGQEMFSLPGHSSAARIAREFDATAEDVRTVIVEARRNLLELVQYEFNLAVQSVIGSPLALESHGTGRMPSPGSGPIQPTEPDPGDTTRQPATTVALDKSQGPDEDYWQLHSPLEAVLRSLDEQAPSTPSDSQERPEDPLMPCTGEVYEGTVRLSVNARSCLRELVRFVDELCQKPQCRLLRLVGNHREGLELWVALREPLHLGAVLQQMKGVALVLELPGKEDGSAERKLGVWLTEPPFQEQG